MLPVAAVSEGPQLLLLLLLLLNHGCCGGGSPGLVEVPVLAKSGENCAEDANCCCCCCELLILEDDENAMGSPQVRRMSHHSSSTNHYWHYHHHSPNGSGAPSPSKRPGRAWLGRQRRRTTDPGRGHCVTTALVLASGGQPQQDKTKRRSYSSSTSSIPHPSSRMKRTMTIHYRRRRPSVRGSDESADHGSRAGRTRPQHKRSSLSISQPQQYSDWYDDSFPKQRLRRSYSLALDGTTTAVILILIRIQVQMIRSAPTRILVEPSSSVRRPCSSTSLTIRKHTTCGSCCCRGGHERSRGGRRRRRRHPRRSSLVPAGTSSCCCATLIMIVG